MIRKIIRGCKEPICILLILIIAGLCFLLGLGNYGILDPTDSFFAEAAREMLERHHYLTALYNYVDWLDKPILSFLPIILSMKLFGITPWATRMPAALCGIALVVETYIFIAPYLGQRAAILSTLVLCSSPLFLLTGHLALSDEVLSLFFSTAMFYAGSSLASNKKINVFAYIFLALAVLTKGPIACILAFNSIALYLIITTSSWSVAIEKFWQLKPWIGIVILIGLCSPYFYWAHITTDGAFTEQFFLRQNLGRMLGTVNHQEPVWFYLPIILGGYFPWILFLMLSLPWLKKIILVRKHATIKQYWIIFCCCWALSVLGLFTAVPTKLPTYIVPASPALAIIIGVYLDRLIYLGRLSVTRFSNILLALPSITVLLGAIIGLFLLPSATTIIDNNYIKMACYAAMIAVAIMAGLSVSSFWQFKIKAGIYNLIIATLIATVIFIPYSFFWFYQTRQVGINRLIETAKEKKGNMAILFSRVPSAVFIMGKPIPEIQSLSELAQFCKKEQKPHMLLATQNCFNIPELKARQHTIARSNKWYLLNVEGYPW